MSRSTPSKVETGGGSAEQSHDNLVLLAATTTDSIHPHLISVATVHSGTRTSAAPGPLSSGSFAIPVPLSPTRLRSAFSSTGPKRSGGSAGVDVKEYVLSRPPVATTALDFEAVLIPSLQRLGAHDRTCSLISEAYGRVVKDRGEKKTTVAIADAIAHILLRYQPGWLSHINDEVTLSLYTLVPSLFHTPAVLPVTRQVLKSLGDTERITHIQPAIDFYTSLDNVRAAQFCRGVHLPPGHQPILFVPNRLFRAYRSSCPFTTIYNYNTCHDLGRSLLQAVDSVRDTRKRNTRDKRKFICVVVVDVGQTRGMASSDDMNLSTLLRGAAGDLAACGPRSSSSGTGSASYRPTASTGLRGDDDVRGRPSVADTPVSVPLWVHCEGIGTWLVANSSSFHGPHADGGSRDLGIIGPPRPKLVATTLGTVEELTALVHMNELAGISLSLDMAFVFRDGALPFALVSRRGPRVKTDISTQTAATAQHSDPAVMLKAFLPMHRQLSLDSLHNELQHYIKSDYLIAECLASYRGDDTLPLVYLKEGFYIVFQVAFQNNAERSTRLTGALVHALARNNNIFSVNLTKKDVTLSVAGERPSSPTSPAMGGLTATAYRGVFAILQTEVGVSWLTYRLKSFASVLREVRMYRRHVARTVKGYFGDRIVINNSRLEDLDILCFQLIPTEFDAVKDTRTKEPQQSQHSAASTPVKQISHGGEPPASLATNPIVKYAEECQLEAAEALRQTLLRSLGGRCGVINVSHFDTLLTTAVCVSIDINELQPRLSPGAIDRFGFQCKAGLSRVLAASTAVFKWEEELLKKGILQAIEMLNDSEGYLVGSTLDTSLRFDLSSKKLSRVRWVSGDAGDSESEGGSP